MLLWWKWCAIAIYHLPGVHAKAFYLPGVAPQEFQAGDSVELLVNKLTSVKTQLPFSYNDMPLCKADVVKMHPANMGQVLDGAEIHTSPYNLQMKVDQSCKAVCKMEYDEATKQRLSKMIDNDYRHHWIMDNLPIAVREYDERGASAPHFSRGFPLGFAQFDDTKNDNVALDPSHMKHYINNHLKLVVRYNEDGSTDGTKQFEGARIVGFEVDPYSIKHKLPTDVTWDAENPPTLDTCATQAASHSNYQGLDDSGTTIVVYSYDVKWVRSEVKWSNRWDVFLTGNPDDQIHWFSIVNSLMIVLFLTGMIAMIMLRTLHKDISKYNEIQTIEDPNEETGWKLVHGDVFRAPSFSPMMMSVFVGTGVQITMMTGATMTFALLGFLSPANRGGLLTAFLLLFVFMGSFAGYHSARLYKAFKGKNWKKNTVLTALTLPGTIFVVFFILNLFVWRAGSSGAVPLSTFFTMLVLWFGVSVPLVFVGSYFGFQKVEIDFPIRTNQIARQIPEQPWYMHPALCILVGGILPFGAVFIELFFIMSAIWLHQIYYLFGFLVIVLAILFATCAEVTIVMCYFQLCSEDYQWWWRSFLTSGSAAIYLFGYSILYFHSKLEITEFVSIMLYFGYMLMISILFFFLTGTFGFFACFWFLQKIYASIKVD